MARSWLHSLQSLVPNRQSPAVCLILLVVHCSLFVLVAACARPDDTWDRVRHAGVIRVGMDASFPPFEAITADGTLIGFDVDLARELGRRLGVEVQFVANLSYDGLYDALAVGRVDAIISALVINPDRIADFAYSAAYFDAGQVLVVRPPLSSPPRAGGTEGGDLTHGEDEGGGSAGDGDERGEGVCGWDEERGSIEEMADLTGCSLAVEFGTQGDLEARKWARRLPALTVLHFETASEALAAVEAGSADAALVDHVSALAADCMGESLVIVGEPVVEEPYGVAVRRDSRNLMQAIDAALAAMEADGTIEALTAEWLR